MKQSRGREKISCPYSVPKSDKWFCPVQQILATGKSKLNCKIETRNQCAKLFVQNKGRIPISILTHPQEYVRGHSADPFDNGSDHNKILEGVKNLDEILDNQETE